MISVPNSNRRRIAWFQVCMPVVLHFIIFACIPGVSAAEVSVSKLPYTIVDTGQVRCYSDRTEIKYPKTGDAFFGQDAQYQGNQAAYRKNGDGTVTDLNTGLMWQSDPGKKKTFKQAVEGASECRVAGYKDWRLPTIKELYSLILFSGTDPDPISINSSRQQPFIDMKYFKFQYGNPDHGERIIDSQFATCTKYVSTTMRGDETMFGVNFADGRIKGYGMRSPRGNGDKKFYVLYVRGNKNYGKNDFKDNNNGTVTDKATGLMWMKVDSGKLKAGKNKDGKMNWQEALMWAENLEYAGYSDWRLPNAKELQSIVDYTRSPDTTDSPAIDPVFQATSITAESSKKDYPFYWTGTTHASLFRCSAAAYVAFGRSFGWMQNRRSGQYRLMDVHGAGSQRSDPKTGDPSRFPHGRGPQGDVIRIYNFVRCVRGGNFVERVMDPDKNSEGEVIKDDMAKQFFKVFPVGTVEKKAGTTCLKIAGQYAEALKGLDGFSHVVVLYWFHENDTPSKRSILQTRLGRFSNSPLAGVFASRAPVRPNPIALSVCRILSVKGNTVRVASIDAFDGTPILDLKPHVSMIDCPGNVKLPDWWRPAGFGGPGGQGRGGPGGPGGGDFVERVMGFDKNGDGKVTKDEMPERMKERMLQRADTNGDGALDKKEVKKFA